MLVGYRGFTHLEREGCYYINYMPLYIKLTYLYFTSLDLFQSHNVQLFVPVFVPLSARDGGGGHIPHGITAPGTSCSSRLTRLD